MENSLAADRDQWKQVSSPLLIDRSTTLTWLAETREQI
jgi:hypothetical protein